jgi:hypothetical protein
MGNPTEQAKPRKERRHISCCSQQQILMKPRTSLMRVAYVGHSQQQRLCLLQLAMCTTKTDQDAVVVDQPPAKRLQCQVGRGKRQLQIPHTSSRGGRFGCGLIRSLSQLHDTCRI